ncbi:MAG: sugar kinase [Casimicrobiaceae bacterium]
MSGDRAGGSDVIITAGELLVEFVSLERGCGLQRLATYNGPYPSGAPAIFIDQAARMGARTAIYGGVGQDGFGSILVDRLVRDGVDVRHVARVEGRSTGTAFVSYFEDGSRVFVFHLDGTAVDAFDVDGCVATDEPLTLHVSGSSLGNARLRRNIAALAQRVLATGGRISVDPNIRPELMRNEDAWAALQDLTNKAHVLMPSEADLEILAPGSDRRTAIAAFHDAGAEIVAIKMGADGCLVSDGSSVEHLPGHRVEEVDPTGAGDCFCGAFVALLERGQSPHEAGRVANAAGALSVTRRGPMEGNPTPGEIESFLRDRREAG